MVKNSFLYKFSFDVYDSTKTLKQKMTTKSLSRKTIPTFKKKKLD